MVTSELELVAKSSAAAFWSRAYAVAFQYIIAILIARFLGPTLMGSFFLGYTILTVLSFLCHGGLGAGLIKFLSIGLLKEDYGYMKKLLLFSTKFVFVVSSVLAVLLIVLRDMLSVHIFSDPNLKLVLIFIAITLPFQSLFYLFIEVLKPFKRIRALVAVQHLLFPTVNFLLIVVLFWMGLKVRAPLISLFLATIMSLAVFSSIFKSVLPKGSYHADRSLDMREIFSVSIPIFLSFIMGLIVTWTDTVMIGIFKTSEEVGLYTAATKTAAFVIFSLQSIHYILPTLAAQLYEKGEKGELELLARRTSRWNLIFSATIMIAFVLFGKEMLTLFGREFVAAYIPLLILSLGQIVNAGVGSTGYILAMTGFQKILSLIAVFSAILNVLLNILLIVPFSILGAALATGFSIALANILAAYVIFKRIGIVPFADNISKVIGYLLIGGAISFAAKFYLGLVGGLVCFLAISTFIITKILLDTSDRMLIRSIVLRGKKV